MRGPILAVLAVSGSWQTDAVFAMKTLGLVLAVTSWVATLGCELVIGDENRVVAEGGNAARPGDAANSPDASGSEPDVSSAPPDACVAMQACVDMAMMCTGLCGDCVGNLPGKDCGKNLAECRMPCLLCAPCVGH
jgi:hypothetical protein